MTSDAQLAANRRNSKKSTGPKTVEGREVARRNALRHGLAAEDLVVPEEEAGDFMSFHDELRAALDPAGAVEELLVERIVVSAWRLRRVYRAEAGMAASENRHWIGNSRNTGKLPAGLVFSERQRTLLALTRYERSIERSLHRALATLQEWQETRRLEAESGERPVEPGPPNPPPWPLDFGDGLPSPHLPRINGFPALGKGK
ncbi:MAG TPA: hypothetical protein VMC10_04600 [Stellaceae bacterium]|nr:hypothetical protein [Stellaceae bacterium]